MKLVKLLANLGYGSRTQVERHLRSGAVTDLQGKVLGARDFPPHGEILFKGEPLDPPAPLTLIFHKPYGSTCSTDDPGDTIYDLLPVRFALRNPILSPVGRLDKETTGMLLMTDDGKLLHRMISPKHHVPKTYHVTLDRPIEGHEQELFASGTLVLRGEDKPLLPARRGNSWRRASERISTTTSTVAKGRSFSGYGSPVCRSPRASFTSA